MEARVNGTPNRGSSRMEKKKMNAITKTTLALLSSPPQQNLWESSGSGKAPNS